MSRTPTTNLQIYSSARYHSQPYPSHFPYREESVNKITVCCTSTPLVETNPTDAHADFLMSIWIFDSGTKSDPCQLYCPTFVKFDIMDMIQDFLPFSSCYCGFLCWQQYCYPRKICHIVRPASNYPSFVNDVAIFCLLIKAFRGCRSVNYVTLKPEYINYTSLFYGQVNRNKRYLVS